MVKGTKIYNRLPDKYLDFIKLMDDQDVPPSTIDKDLVLGHLIAGIFGQKWAAEAWNQSLGAHLSVGSLLFTFLKLLLSDHQFFT